MRLSKPLLDNHRRQRPPDRYCTEGETHHVPLLRRLMPHAEQTTLERLSWFTCARRDEMLTAKSHFKDSGTALDDVAFLRSVLLELAFVTGGSVFPEPEISRSTETVQDDEVDLSVSKDGKDTGSESTGVEEVQTTGTELPTSTTSATIGEPHSLVKTHDFG